MTDPSPHNLKKDYVGSLVTIDLPFAVCNIAKINICWGPEFHQPQLIGDWRPFILVVNAVHVQRVKNLHDNFARHLIL